jgi:hypothetical protein
MATVLHHSISLVIISILITIVGGLYNILGLERMMLSLIKIS